MLKRAIKTLQNVLEQLDQLWVPVEKSWRLNERHYGDLQGRNKAETAKKFGDKQVHVWRRSYDVPPAGRIPAQAICHDPAFPDFAAVTRRLLFGDSRLVCSYSQLLSCMYVTCFL